MNKQNTIATRQAQTSARRITGTVIVFALRIFTKILPAIAAEAPTEISCHLVAEVTKVIPIARITSSEAPFKILTKFPARTVFPRLFFLITIEKKLGSRIRLKITRTTSAVIGIIS